MPAAELKRTDGIAYREVDSGGGDGLPVLCLHGFPESSYMWRHLLESLAQSGRRAVGPDLPGYGDSPPDPPGTWERNVEAVERFRTAVGLDRAVLAVHDWGGLIGLRWACDHPDAVAGLVISNTGFFPDGEWHGMAKAMRTEGQGEALVDSISREGLGALLKTAGQGFDDDAAADEYWKTFTTEAGRRGVLELYRSGDFSKLEPYRGRLAELAVPTLVLWGENDEFAPPAGAHRFVKEIPDAKLVMLPEAGHFVWEDDPERCAREVLAFLEEAGL